MILDLVRDASTVFPSVDHVEKIRSVRIWHCKYKSLKALVAFTNLEELEIATFPDNSFDMLASLTSLRYLSILHMPKVTELEPLSGLDSLESLSLSTSPSWDSARKFLTISSLAPLTKLKSLKHLELFGVCPADKSLATLEPCRHLISARFSQYPKNEIDRFYLKTGAANQFNPKPSFLSSSA